MRTWNKNGAAVAVLCGVLWGVLSTSALADIKDYEFQLVQTETKKGDGAIVLVRLVNKKSGKPVPDAVIFAKRIDMAPDAMQEMTAPLEQLPSTEPGVYRLRHEDSGAARYYVVQSDPHESDLAPWTEPDRERVQRHWPTVQFNNDRRAVVAAAQEKLLDPVPK